MRKFLALLMTSISILGSATAQNLAFPGAEGFGKYAKGGRGGQVVEVTNLNDSGPGSFRQALLEYPNDPITVVFRVSGIIELQTEIALKRSNVTIAGQTAPGDGICLKGASFILNGARALSQGGNHGNVIIRHLRSRPGAYASSGVYGFDMENCHDVIVDHCSFSWANEECAALYDTKNTTVQWCIVSEGLYSAGHLKGVRSYGGVWGGQYATYHHNLVAHQQSRTVRFNGARAHDTVALIDYRNNVIYNWGSSGACYGGEVEIPNGLSQVNIINNYYKNGPATATPLQFAAASYTAANAKGTGEWYLSGNVMYGSQALTANNAAGLNMTEVPAGNRTYAISAAPFAISVPVNTQSANDAYDAVLAYNGAGATIPRRDPVDVRVVKETLTGTYSGTGTKGMGIIDSPKAVGGWPVYDTYNVATDSDHDGMPDYWELAHNLNPNDAADRNNIGTAHYTNLEVYLNEMAIPAVPNGIPGLGKTVATLQCYPNPATDAVMVSHPVTKGNAAIHVFTIDGKRLSIQEINAGAAKTEINISALPKGLYLVIYEHGQERQVGKLMKD